MQLRLSKNWRTIGGAAVMAGIMSAAQAAEVSVQVDGLRNSNGSIAICLWKDHSGFPDCSRSKSAQMRTISAGTPGPIVFRNLPPGTFAITLIHDENANGQFDTNLLGIPKEGAGASNNAISRFGPPNYARSSFNVTRAAEQRIKLIYWLN